MLTSERALQRSVPSGRMRDEQAVALIDRWQSARDEHARQCVVEAFLPMARRLANRYRTPGEIDDLYQVASLGLLGAIDRFDCDRGSSFVGFAIPTILGELKRYFRNTGWAVHVPRAAQEMAQRVQRAAREIEDQQGRAPRVTDLAEYLEVDIEDVLMGLEAATAHYADSLDAAMPGPGGSFDEQLTLHDRIGEVDDVFARVDLKLSLARLLPRLSYAERRAFELRRGGEVTQQQIADQLGCSQMQVSRLLRRAAARIRAEICTESLMSNA